ncbi:hypothetical protein TREES_T100002656 [Tupaia chinensis]|uniref:Uncharacterized protein n=1 Tax=Tupaia chinensis TaxID=246437 RepID=L9L5R3_TUPCH|nr:hypothetical protein TREES_T100002656 [Tupaia chinensis]
MVKLAVKEGSTERLLYGTGGGAERRRGLKEGSTERLLYGTGGVQKRRSALNQSRGTTITLQRGWSFVTHSSSNHVPKILAQQPLSALSVFFPISFGNHLTVVDLQAEAPTYYSDSTVLPKPTTMVLTINLHTGPNFSNCLKCGPFKPLFRLTKIEGNSDDVNPV